jgi:hypothetical protein
MADRPNAPIPLGSWDLYRRTPSLLLGNGTIKFIPGKGARGESDVRDAEFPSGSTLEYGVQMGDMFFDGDHSQALGASLWVIAPDGSKKLLASGYNLYMRLSVTARNLKKRGVPFRAVSFYQAKDGQDVEQELSIPQSGTRFPVLLFLGLSNLWLGAIAGALIHSWTYIIAVGAFAFAILAVIRLRVAPSKRVALISVASALVSYAAGYFVVVVLVRESLLSVGMRR